MVEQVRPSVSGAAEKMREGAQEFKQAVATSATEAYERAAGKFNEYSDEASDLIKGRPLTSVLVAFGAGLLLGVLFFRRS